jgi:hypothetical protein
VHHLKPLDAGFDQNGDSGRIIFHGFLNALAGRNAYCFTALKAGQSGGEKNTAQLNAGTHPDLRANLLAGARRRCQQDG